MDFKAPIEKTSTKLAKDILGKVMEYQDDLIFDMTTRTPELNREADEKIADLSIAIVQMIAATDLPADYIEYPIEKIMAILSGLKISLTGNLRQNEDEVMSRFYGVKNSETGKYRKELITVGDLMMKLKEVREATGDDPSDYFNDEVPEMPKE
jgi:hypothetical protein